jgi:hypothetical protein
MKYTSRKNKKNVKMYYSFINKLDELQQIIRFLTINFNDYDYTDSECLILESTINNFINLLFSINNFDKDNINNQIITILETTLGSNNKLYNLIKRNVYNFGKHLIPVFVDYFSIKQ